MVRVADQDLWDEEQAAGRTHSGAWSEHGLMAVRDAGFTEVEPGTVPCWPAGPDPDDRHDPAESAFHTTYALSASVVMASTNVS